MEQMIGGRLAAEELIERGVEYVFTISGGHITPIYQFLENSPVRLFDTRHEQAAVFMAEAYGRLMRRPGIAMVTAGPGFTNALSGIANARLSNSPLVLISGSVGLESIEKLDLQDMRQAPVIEPMVKKAFVCHSPQRIPEFVDLAFRNAISGRPGPVYLELPVDVLNAGVDPSKARKVNTTCCESHPVDIQGAAKIVEMIRKAKKPLVIAGSGAWYSDAAEELVRFVENTGIPALTSSQGRGTIPDTHPLCFESSLAIRPGAALVANTSADLVLFLGSRMNLYYIFGDVFNHAARIVQVDLEPEEMGRNRTVDLAVVSDVKALLKECNRLIQAEGISEGLKSSFKGWVNSLVAADKESKSQTMPMWESDAVPIHALRAAQEINTFMDRPDDIVVADGGDAQIWMGMTRTVRRPGRYLDSNLYGCLGVGLPYANAAQLTNPGKRVCLFCGDGSIGFNFMEFETAIRKKLPVVVVISNDLGWGMIRHSQQLRLGHPIKEGTEIGYVPYHKLVEALGGFGAEVRKPGDIRPALEAAFASGRTSCINVMTDPDTISPGSIALANLGSYKA
ncbi:MAG: thiamine pyrophosphate-binding protein [Bacteriovoracaceae bacterium]|nr:thiamine pyrophosphate-binding protein [Bacteriovoracaceae bacterium]HNU74596.1 thiamine pyrophosphate-binding protein [Deltaproteobacteria bacterium]HRR20416.1 thiamine pyrophosphate-binding protein [Desulfomonilia bacterium]HON61807.1 thiamine pyrophosphate-binding protein [Deltaproteobacteria bacterium]HPV30655.1 thiamine pyrophosphate-binding protein [Deltaproteobacteria bacterium]